MQLFKVTCFEIIFVLSTPHFPRHLRTFGKYTFHWEIALVAQTSHFPTISIFEIWILHCQNLTVCLKGSLSNDLIFEATPRFLTILHLRNDFCHNQICIPAKRHIVCRCYFRIINFLYRQALFGPTPTFSRLGFGVCVCAFFICRCQNASCPNAALLVDLTLKK